MSKKEAQTSVMNPVIGDKALEAFQAQKPNAKMSEVDKVRCHVSFALNEVKANVHTTNIDPQIKHRRTKLLAELVRYINAGNFPLHEDTDAIHDRKPCFIDSTGTPCAVAHLMQESEAGALANAIAATHKHNTISEIAADKTISKDFMSWVNKVGLDVSELALIQPTYEFVAYACKRKFDAILKIIKAVVKKNKDVKESEKHEVARKILEFAHYFDSELWEQDIPYYLTTLNDFKIPSHLKDSRALISVLRREIEVGAYTVKRLSGAKPKKLEAKDYEGLLSKKDLKNTVFEDYQKYNDFFELY